MIHTSSNQQWYRFGRKCWYQHGCHHNSVFGEEISIAVFFFLLFQKVHGQQEVELLPLPFLCTSSCLHMQHVPCSLTQPYPPSSHQWHQSALAIDLHPPQETYALKKTLKTYIQSQGQLSMTQSCTCIPLPPALHKRNSTPYCRTYSTYFK